MCPWQNDIHFLFTVGHWVVTWGYILISVSLFVYQQAGLWHAETTAPIFTKFSGKAAHGPMKKRLDFVGIPDLDQDPGIFWMNYATAVLAMVKAPHSVFDSSVKIHRLVRIRKSQLNWFDHHSKFGCWGNAKGSHTFNFKMSQNTVRRTGGGLGARRSWVVYFMSGRKWKSRNCFRFVPLHYLGNRIVIGSLSIVVTQTPLSRISERLFQLAPSFPIFLHVNLFPMFRRNFDFPIRWPI